MSSSTFFIPAVNIMGAGCLKDALATIKSHGFKKGLIVTDVVLTKIGMVNKLLIFFLKAVLLRLFLMVHSQTQRLLTLKWVLKF